MEPNQSQPNTERPTTENGFNGIPSKPLPQVPQHHNVKKIVAASIVIVLVVALGLWYMLEKKEETIKNTPQTPEQTLQDLQQSSQPLTSTSVREKQIVEINKVGKAPTSTPDQRLQDFNALKH